jgi:hypothetical protein
MSTIQKLSNDNVAIIDKSKMKKCFDEFNDVCPNLVDSMREYDSKTICRLKGLIKNEQQAKNMWENDFGNIAYLDYESVSKDDLIYYFLELHDHMILKNPGVMKLVKNHFF